MSMGQIMVVAENEFSTIVKKPIVLVFILVVFVLYLIEAFGSNFLMQTLLQVTTYSHEYMILKYCLGNSFFITSFLFCVLSMSLGIFSIADERNRGSLRVLICKPLYRRDIVIGKVIGVSSFLALTIGFILTVFTATSIIIYPISLASVFLDIVIRMVSYVFLLLLLCILTLTITMMIGVLLKNIIAALTLSMAIVYIQWYSDIPNVLGVLSILNPERLYIYAINYSNINIFNSTIPYMDWLSGSFPYIVLLIAEILVLTLINCLLLDREDF